MRSGRRSQWAVEAPIPKGSGGQTARCPLWTWPLCCWRLQRSRRQKSLAAAFYRVTVTYIMCQTLSCVPELSHTNSEAVFGVTSHIHKNNSSSNSRWPLHPFLSHNAKGQGCQWVRTACHCLSKPESIAHHYDYHCCQTLTCVNNKCSIFRTKTHKNSRNSLILFFNLYTNVHSFYSAEIVMRFYERKELKR